MAAPKGNKYAYGLHFGRPQSVIFDNEMMAISCRKCNEIKNYVDFTKSNKTPSGISRICNKCRFANEDKIHGNLRSKIHASIKRSKGVKKSTRTVELLGCSLDEYKKYLSDRFTKGMTWDNYGKVWHIDHIIPIASFDFKDEHQLRQCFNYTNTRPLDAKENNFKRDKLTHPQFKILI